MVYEVLAIGGGEKTKPIQSQFAGEMEPVQTIPIPIHDNRDEAATRRRKSAI